MRYNDQYGDKTSTADKPCAVTSEAMKAYPPDVEQVLEGCDFNNLRELAAAYREAWNALACDKWLLNKRTRQDMPEADVLLTRAKRISTSADVDRKTFAAAESLWLRKFERKELTRRRNALFSGDKSSDKYFIAKNELARIYRYSEADLEAWRYFVCQARRDDADPALNRAVYLWSEEKMTGKTTVARIVAGILNGCGTWEEARRGVYLSDIPCELQFGGFDRPKATRYACVVMDEAFAGKSTAKYYGKFKTAITSDTANVNIKFGSAVDIPCTRNYIFTSNNDIASVVADESERRLFEIHAQRPVEMDYEKLYRVWLDFIVNAPEEPDTAKWYRDTMPKVKGEVGVTKDDIKSAFVSPEFLAAVEDYARSGNNATAAEIASGNGVSSVNRYQLSYPKFFTDFIAKSYDVRKNANIIKDAVVTLFGEPCSSSNRRYYNIIPLKATLEDLLKEQPEQPATAGYTQDNEMELPY